jgi:hypothetical protein
MPASPAQIAANRANALKSTGPKTPEGKARSRANALKHGLTGDGTVLPAADAEEVQRRDEALQAEFQPSTEFGVMMVRRIALLSVRMERCAGHETATINLRVSRAGDDFDDRRADDADALFESLPDAPAANVRRLRRTEEGIDRLLSAWQGLTDDLDDTLPYWGEAHTALAENLTGHKTGSVPVPPVRKLALLLQMSMAPTPGPHPALRDPVTPRQKLVALIEREMAALRAAREALDPEQRAQERALASELALFDPSDEATLARRYEAAAERGLFRALRELRAAEAAVAASAVPDATVKSSRPSNELASFRPVPAPPAAAPVKVETSAQAVHKSEPMAYNPAWETDLRRVSIVRAPADAGTRIKDDITEALVR